MFCKLGTRRFPVFPGAAEIPGVLDTQINSGSYLARWQNGPLFDVGDAWHHGQSGRQKIDDVTLDRQTFRQLPEVTERRRSHRFQRPANNTVLPPCESVWVYYTRWQVDNGWLYVSAKTLVLNQTHTHTHTHTHPFNGPSCRPTKGQSTEGKSFSALF